jgi:hypothetical protein
MDTVTEVAFSPRDPASEKIVLMKYWMDYGTERSCTVS